MKFSYEIKEDICHAIYEGDRTLEDIYLFVKSFFALIDAEEIQSILLNLRIVEMLNSNGIGQIVRIHKQAMSQHKRLIFIINHYTQQVLQIVQLQHVLEFAESPEEALQRLSSSR